MRCFADKFLFFQGPTCLFSLYCHLHLILFVSQFFRYKRTACFICKSTQIIHCGFIIDQNFNLITDCRIINNLLCHHYRNRALFSHCIYFMFHFLSPLVILYIHCLLPRLIYFPVFSRITFPSCTT